MTCRRAGTLPYFCQMSLFISSDTLQVPGHEITADEIRWWFPRTLTVTKILSATITGPMSKRIAPCTANRWPEFLSEALTALYLSCFSQVVPGTSDILCPEHPRRLKACDHTYASLTGAHALHKIWELSIVSTNKKNLGQNL